MGTVPLGTAPVGLAVSPDGRWIYASSESGRGAAAAQAAGQLATGQTAGTVTAIDLRQAETRPADAVAGTVPAGCSPVRVVTDYLAGQVQAVNLATAP